jgi:hypothetical protein
MASYIKQYGWKDISVAVFGRIIEGITDVKVKRTVSKERQYGRGNQTQHILTGNEEVSGTLTVHQAELDAINAAIKKVNPTLDITKVAFEVVINYENEERATTDVIRGVNVSEYEKGMAQGDVQMAIELPFVATAFQEDI